jgi:hypothetical protein
MTSTHHNSAWNSSGNGSGRVVGMAAPTFVATRRAGLAAALFASALASFASAQDPAAKPGDAVPAADAPAGEPLRAVFIDVSGKVQWRANDSAPWQEAKVNDVVAAGVEVRTGLRSHAALRVGRNATALLDAGTLFQLPTIAQDGETLRTSAAVKHGRADFKVDKVGLSNDFKVVTPSTTLAVRGTEFAVATGALKQVEVLGARKNAINAIELKYALNNNAVQLSGGSGSSSGVQHPANAGAEQASAPATTATQIPSTSQGERERSAGSGPSPTQAGGVSEQARGSRRTVAVQKASGSSGGSNSVQSRIQDQINVANDKIDQAVEYLLQAQNADDVVQAQRDALSGLQSLAGSQRDNARAALARHTSALEDARALEADAGDAVRSFDGRAEQVAADFTRFDQARGSASDALESIRSILGEIGNGGIGNGEVGSDIAGGQSALIGSRGIPGGGEGQVDPLSQSIDALRDALLAMGDARDAAGEGRDAMAADRDAVVAAVNSIDAGARTDASAAITEYQTAIAALQAAVQSGQSAASIAQASRDTVARLEGLIAAIAAESPTEAAKLTASRALDRLSQANLALSRALLSLDAVRAARTSATDDVRAEALGEVEALYQGLVAVRLRVVADWAAADSGVRVRDGQLADSVADAEGALGEVGTHLAGRAFFADQSAFAEASFAEGQLASAAASAAREEDEFGLADAIESAATAQHDAIAAEASAIAGSRTDVQDAAKSAMLGLAELDQSAAIDRFAASDAAIASLDAMNDAMDSVLAHALSLDGLVGDGIDRKELGAELGAIAERASQAIAEVLAARDAVDGAAARGADLAEAAGTAAAAADHLRTVALELGNRFGLSTEFVSTAASAAASLAGRTYDSAGRAAAAQKLVAALAAVAEQNRVGAIVGRIDSMLASNATIDSQARADIAAARQAYVSTNESGAGTFGRLTASVKDEVLGVQAEAQSAISSLSEMATSSTQLVAAFDGAEAAAGNAERAFGSAMLSRIDAENNEQAAYGGLARTQGALENDNLSAAREQSGLTDLAAGASRSAAILATAYSDTAKNEATRAESFQIDADRLKPIVQQFGTNREAFVAAASGRRAAIDDANAAASDLSSQAQFFDDVTQVLAARAGTVAAAESAAGSDSARSLALAAAAQLSAAATQAQQMEQTASTNAGRAFGRSMSQYVARAQAAAAGAEAQAQGASAAATRAEASAATARNLVSSAGGTPPTVRGR